MGEQQALQRVVEEDTHLNTHIDICTPHRGRGREKEREGKREEERETEREEQRE